MNRFLQNVLLFMFMTALSAKAAGQTQPATIGNRLLREGWQIQSSARVSAEGKAVSSEGFEPKGWYTTTVPHTVLGALVDDGVYQHVFYHRNLEKIPDSLFTVPWWYRKDFRIANKGAGQVYRLAFDGISYRADIWLNGIQIAAADTLDGSFRQFSLDITPYIKVGTNILALKVTQAKGGELNIGFVDWNPEPADHNMGIWRDVHLISSGPVAIEQPFVRSKVDTVTLTHADLTLSTNLQNHSDKPVDGVLHAGVGKSISLEKKIHLEAHQTKTIVLSPSEYAALSMDHPRLWWTHELGKPNLYALSLSFTAGKQLSDSLHLKFGIRTVSGYMTKEGFRGYRLNGKKILIKGGGWTDPMLLNASPAYEAAGVDYAVHMNLNTLRMEGFWGQNQHIYDLCDEKGILIMAGFSCQWEWKHNFGTNIDDKYSAIITPEQIDMAAKSWRDQLLWLRNHPSIFLWLYGSDKWPRPELEKKYLAILKQVDPTRPYVQSAQEHTSEITGPTGMKMRGPYDYVPPDYWYIDTANGGAFGFNTETGPGPEVPVLESLKKMIPADSLWPIGSAWMYHAARGSFHNLAAYNRAMDNRLGKPRDLHDYLRKAQYLNYEGMRAMFEAFETNRFKATGIIQWMYNASWPKLWWQLYDYYLMPTGAFYGARKALEPVHIAYNYGTRTVMAFNNTARDTTGLLATITVLDTSLKKVLEKTVSLNTLASRGTDSVYRLPPELKVSRTWFLDLRLSGSNNRQISHNFYVLSTQKDVLNEKESNWYVTPQLGYADLGSLERLPPVKLDTAFKTHVSGDTTWVSVAIKNASGNLAFMVHLDLRNAATGTSVTPVFWEENYLTLLPGETHTVSGYCHTADLKGGKPAVTVDGWNVP